MNVLHQLVNVRHGITIVKQILHHTSLHLRNVFLRVPDTVTQTAFRKRESSERTCKNKRRRYNGTHPRKDDTHQVTDAERMIVISKRNRNPPASERVPHDSTQYHQVVRVGDGVGCEEVCHDSREKKWQHSYKYSSFSE